MRTEKWYQRRLAKYFEDNYNDYVEGSEWFVNPRINMWKCYIPELNQTITFTCDDEGNVIEKKEGLTMDVDKLYAIVNGSCRGMDAIYEDYLIRLVGDEGFKVLRNNKLLQTCGSIDGRTLYVLCDK